MTGSYLRLEEHLGFQLGRWNIGKVARATHSHGSSFRGLLVSRSLEAHTGDKPGKEKASSESTVQCKWTWLHHFSMVTFASEQNESI